MRLKSWLLPLSVAGFAFFTLACTGPNLDDTSGSDDDNGFWDNDDDDDDDGWDDDDGGNCGGSYSGRVYEQSYHDFTVETDRDVAFELEWDQNTDLDLHLLDGDGYEVMRAETDGKGTGESRTFWVQAGDYTAMVVNWDSETETDYELQISCR